MLQVRSKTKLFFADDTTVVIELHPQEVMLLNLMRNKFKFGELSIMMRDGLPVRIEKPIESIDLTRGLDSIGI